MTNPVGAMVPYNTLMSDQITKICKLLSEYIFSSCAINSAKHNTRSRAQGRGIIPLPSHVFHHHPLHTSCITSSRRGVKLLQRTSFEYIDN